MIFLIFTGVPVKTIFLAFFILGMASLKETNIVFVFLAKILIAFPGNALLSCNTVGIPNLCASEIVAPQMYPPVPITTSGLNSLIIFF